MIRRLLGSPAVRVAAVGALGAAVVLLGALIDQWRVAAAGLALTALSLVVLSLLMLRGVQRAQRAVGSAASLGGGARGDGIALAEELSLARAIDGVLERRDLAAGVDAALRAHSIAERAELAALIRLVSGHDTTPPVPLETGLPAAQAFAVVGVLEERRPRRVLAIGTAASTLWTARTLRDLGATVDLVCAEASAARLAELVATRGLDDAIRVVPAAMSVPEAPYAVRPWFVLPDDRYDLVVVAAATPMEARAALPALPLLLERLERDGSLVVVEDQARPVLGPSWSAASSTIPDVTTGDPSFAGSAVVLRAAPDPSPVAVGDPEPAATSAEDAPR